MAGPEHSSRFDFFGVSSAACWGILWSLVVAGGAAFIVWCLRFAWRNSAPGGTVPDPSVVIGTFITLYGLFLGGFGVLIGFIAKRGKKEGRWEAFRVMALAILIEGAGLDLWRVLNSTGDLFTAATSRLSYRVFNDTVFDFKIYFFINVFVVAFSIMAASLLSAESPDSLKAATTAQSSERGPGRSSLKDDLPKRLYRSVSRWFASRGHAAR